MKKAASKFIFVVRAYRDLIAYPTAKEAYFGGEGKTIDVYSLVGSCVPDVKLPCLEKLTTKK